MDQGTSLYWGQQDDFIYIQWSMFNLKSNKANQFPGTQNKIITVISTSLQNDTQKPPHYVHLQLSWILFAIFHQIYNI